MNKFSLKHDIYRPPHEPVQKDMLLRISWEEIALMAQLQKRTEKKLPFYLSIASLSSVHTQLTYYIFLS